MLSGEQQKPACGALRASQSTLPTLYDVGARMALQPDGALPALSQRLAAISGGKRLVVDGTSTIAGDMMAEAGCSARRDSRDGCFQNRRNVTHCGVDLPVDILTYTQ